MPVPMATSFQSKSILPCTTNGCIGIKSILCGTNPVMGLDSGAMNASRNKPALGPFVL